jgi:hypothetical protein
MGWLWGSGESSENKDKLDPSLRDFLDAEAPSGNSPTLPSKPRSKPAEDTNPAQRLSADNPTPSETPAAPASPVVPPESQFQDGRYAHLWKNYTPQHILVDRSKSEQDKLRDIVDAYNDRRAAIGRAAMENCALEYLEQFECMKAPSWWQAATVCRTETRKFNKCYETQAKFLKALGYLTMDARSPEEDERIQMHADKLYQQLMQQEAQIEQAKEEGREIPKFESVLSRRNVAQAMGGKPLASKPLTGTEKVDNDDENDVWSHIKPSAREEYEKKLAELPAEEQDFERKALLGELRAQTGVAQKVEGAFIEERINRMKRRERGQATIGDTIKRLWGWD